MLFKKATRAPKTEAPARATVTDAAPCQKSVRMVVGQEVIVPVRSEVLAEFQKQATVAGFRKGKAPADLVERHYAKEIQDETLRRVTRQAFEQAAKEHALKPVGPFEVSRATFTEAEGLTLEATVERALQALLDAGTAFDYAAVKALASPSEPTVPKVAIPAPDLTVYDRLLQGGAL